ncbi:MAG: LysR family transcriptional regulator [Gammaproteobacteria bacterium]|nr:LysR family transcriptional regulator [Gammaproteobacteria bacterium]
MNIEELQAFLTVAEQGSFTRASESLFLTQPAVSKRIAALEQELNARFFDRIGHRIELTEAGRALQLHASLILNAIEDSRRAIANLGGEIGGRLSLATSHHIGLHRLPPVLRSYTRAHPDVQLDLRFMDSEAACRAVEHGELELAIVTLPDPRHSTLELLPLWEDTLHLVTATDHPLSRKKQITLAQLCQHPAILPAHGTFTRELIEQKLGAQARNLHVVLETNYLETIKMMVSIGLGWSFLPETMLDRSLHVRRNKEFAVKRTLGVVRHPQRTLSNAARALIEACATST